MHDFAIFDRLSPFLAELRPSGQNYHQKINVFGQWRHLTHADRTISNLTATNFK